MTVEDGISKLTSLLFAPYSNIIILSLSFLTSIAKVGTYVRYAGVCCRYCGIYFHAISNSFKNCTTQMIKKPNSNLS